MPAQKAKRQYQKKSDLAVRHLGIIAMRCRFWYKFLPISVRYYYDIEDMIGEVVVTVVQQTKRFDAKRGRESTMVYHTADNACKTILAHYQRKKFTDCTTVELSPAISRKLGVEESEKYQLSLNAVERVIAFGSDALLDLLEVIFTNSLKGRRLCITEELVLEFQRLARAQSANYDDFIRVMQNVHA